MLGLGTRWDRKAGRPTPFWGQTTETPRGLVQVHPKRQVDGWRAGGWFTRWIPAVESRRWDQWRFRVEEKRGQGKDKEQPEMWGVGGYTEWGTRQGREFERRDQEWGQELTRVLVR